MLDYELELDLDGEMEVDNLDGEFESEEFLSLIPTLAPLAISAISSLLKESELEAEFPVDDGEFEDEFEYEGDFESRISNVDDALMEELGYAAAMSENEAEAEAFLGAIASLAGKALPVIAGRVVPGLVKGAARLGRKLFKRGRRGRRVVFRTMPHVLRRTGKVLARRHAMGKPVNQAYALRALRRQLYLILRNQRLMLQILRRNSRIARRPMLMRRAL